MSYDTNIEYNQVVLLYHKLIVYENYYWTITTYSCLNVDGLDTTGFDPSCVLRMVEFSEASLHMETSKIIKQDKRVR